MQRATPPANDSLLISPSQLRQRLAGGGIVLLHVGERAEYNAGHIPGARFMPYDAITTRKRDGHMLELPPAQVLDSVFESLGVSDGSRIVLYWGKDWYSPTTRVLLTLDYRQHGVTGGRPRDAAAPAPGSAPSVPRVAAPARRDRGDDRDRWTSAAPEATLIGTRNTDHA